MKVGAIRTIGDQSRRDEINQISAVDPHPRKRIAVLDSEMSYVEVGEGDPIVFLHGNPTSSYLWRNVIPYLMRFGRCLSLYSSRVGTPTSPAHSPSNPARSVVSKT